MGSEPSKSGPSLKLCPPHYLETSSATPPPPPATALNMGRGCGGGVITSLFNMLIDGTFLLSPAPLPFTCWKPKPKP